VPVIVLSNNDGCAIARSEEAKALHIKMGDPVFKIRDVIKRRDRTAIVELRTLVS
jgi:DNA polymerase V